LKFLSFSLSNRATYISSLIHEFNLFYQSNFGLLCEKQTGPVQVTQFYPYKIRSLLNLNFLIISAQFILRNEKNAKNCQDLFTITKKSQLNLYFIQFYSARERTTKRLTLIPI